MTEEIKEILDRFNKGHDELTVEEYILLENYITNLQQDLDKANDIIEKDRQFYKCRMDEYVDLKKENERLKEDNLLIKSANKLVSDNLHNYKSRCEKANKIITDFMCTEEYCNVDPVAIAENYMEIQKALNGSDE